jgi:regulatory protein
VTLGPDDRIQRALELAYSYLNRRERTETEVRRRLEQRGVEASVIAAAIRTLLDQGYLDDARFAALFAQDKRELEYWGADRIRRTLRQRGIDRELIDETLGAESEESELDRALDLLRRRFPSPPRDRRERDRALGVMLRKGYESELALDALAAHARDAPGRRSS